MCSQIYISSIQHIQSPLDCRRLTLYLRFYQLSSEQVLDFGKKYVNWVNDIIDNHFVVQWGIDYQKVAPKSIVKEINKPLPENTGRKISFEAYVKSPVCKNVTELRKYRKYIQRVNPVYHYGWDTVPLSEFSSADYPHYLNSILPPVYQGADDTKHTIKDIFQEPGRKMKAFHYLPDFSGRFIAEEYQNVPYAFYGEAHLSLGAFCLGNMIDDYANLLLNYARLISQEYTNVNIHIGLQPSCAFESQYMRYFGTNAIYDASHEDTPYSEKEWYSTYYLRGIEWANILSPQVQKRINTKMQFEDQLFTTEILPNNCIMVRSNGLITGFDYERALSIKKYLLPVLYPGGSHVPLRGLYPRKNELRVFDWCPRNDWAIIPIEEDEIAIIGTDLVYRSKNRRRIIHENN